MLFFCTIQVAANNVFREVTLRLDVRDQERRWLLEQTNHVEEKSYAELKLPAGLLETRQTHPDPGLVPRGELDAVVWSGCGGQQ